MTNELDFSGKQVLVVGGSSGIGNGIAQAFRVRGAQVAVCGTRAHAKEYSQAGGSDLTGLGINIDAQFARGAHAFFGSGEQCIRDRFEQNLAFYPALALEIIQHCNKFRIHKNSSRPQDKKEWDTSSHSNAARSRVDQSNLLPLFVKMVATAGRHPEQSRGIPRNSLKRSAAASLAFAQDNRVLDASLNP